MIKPEILNEAPLSTIELKGILKKNQKTDEELNFRAGKALDYLDQFTKLKPAEYKKFYKKIEDLKVTRLKDVHIIKILDILPTTAEEVKSVMQGYPVSLTATDQKKIAEVIAESIK